MVLPFRLIHWLLQFEAPFPQQVSHELEKCGPLEAIAMT